ncbi:MAG: transposase [Deltaproteobacteria bacterium]|nr:transposase [Deltaproteobacteria bacterium]
MRKNRKKYDTAFKLEAIRLVIEEGRKVSEVERNLDISRDSPMFLRRKSTPKARLPAILPANLAFLPKRLRGFS